MGVMKKIQYFCHMIIIVHDIYYSNILRQSSYIGEFAYSVLTSHHVYNSLFHGLYLYINIHVG
jgi:hypothetical protein